MSVLECVMSHVVVVLVEMDSLSLTVVVTLSLNVMCVHAFVQL